ncbi:hypothetical protein J2Z32_001368 [Paenibacillus turicensis]|uniref:DinB-like domain-containing protein n=1 Tax=Paenibacillus turicensis TaxID=160487 RepID=A0ABS4FQ85_9BACL|nr:DinB family protein [Paenibacillus turicensis]MBP1904744.1 hypothetical protein [Paenibacillus turicensis]
MRSTKEALDSLEETIKQYVAELERLSMNDLLYTTDEVDWSLGQMYMHLIQASQNMHMFNIKQCLTGMEPATISSATASTSKTEQGQAIFDQGGFAPIRIAVPASPQYTPKQPESKEQLLSGLLQVLEEMKQLEPRVNHTISDATETNEYKIAHPRFGYLDAKEWFLLIEMHFCHHLLQLARLKQKLGAKSSQ